MKNIFCFFLMISSSVYASQFPVITSMSVEYYSWGAVYSFTQKLMDVGASADTVPPAGWYVGLMHKHHNDDGSWTGNLEDDVFITADGTKNMSSLGVYLFKNGGASDSDILHNGSNGFPECVGYIAGPRGYSPATSYAIDWNSSVIAPGGCMMVPPANEWCKITTPELVLEHGTITLKQADGDIATSSMGVECTTATAVTFNLLTQDKYVYLDEGKSEINVDDKPLNTKIDLPTGKSQMIVKDLLTGVTKEGFHTGSSVLVMMPY
ncbi:hypothetical protein [Enterobacter asburiae]|uniref:hypothetical protein n=1 Tax=Enterobacter asburiae TaxID=61645 RepID=UPI00403DD00E